MKKYIAAGAVAFVSLFGAVACATDELTEGPDQTPPAAPTQPIPEPGPIVPEPETDTDSAGPAEVVAPPIENFNGAHAEVYPFQVYVNEAYIDPDGYITDGTEYFYDNAPPGMEYHIFNIQITNNGESPAAFYTDDTKGYDAEGKIYYNDQDAEFTVADDYLGDYLNPGASVETDIIFLLPEGTGLVEVDVKGYDTLLPFN